MFRNSKPDFSEIIASSSWKSIWEGILQKGRAPRAHRIWPPWARAFSGHRSAAASHCSTAAGHRNRAAGHRSAAGGLPFATASGTPFGTACSKALKDTNIVMPDTAGCRWVGMRGVEWLVGGVGWLGGWSEGWLVCGWAGWWVGCVLG